MRIVFPHSSIGCRCIWSLNTTEGRRRRPCVTALADPSLVFFLRCTTSVNSSSFQFPFPQRHRQQRDTWWGSVSVYTCFSCHYSSSSKLDQMKIVSLYPFHPPLAVATRSELVTLQKWLAVGVKAMLEDMHVYLLQLDGLVFSGWGLC